MRKIFLAVAAMAMLVTACTKDDAVSGGTESLVSFTIDSPELATRADGDGEHITHLQYAFYNENGILAEISKIGDDAIEFTGKATIQVYLVEGRTYSAIFWADNAAAPYDVTFDEDNVSESTMTIRNTTWTANSDIYDAFYKFEGNIRPEEKTHRVELTRPFAQINIATADTEAARKAGVEVATSEVAVVKGYKTLSLVDGEVSDKADFTFSAAALPDDPATVTVGDKTYNMLAMNYVLVNRRELLQKVALTMVDDDNKTLTREYTTVPVQRNYRTYIVGNLLTTPNDFNIETKPGFDGTEEYVVWDGTSSTKPEYDDVTKTYTVDSGADLAWLANLVNGTLLSHMRSTEEYAPAETLQGYTIVLDEKIDDIDLGGHQWTPIGTSDKPFQGTFDGNGKVIKNLVITGNNSNVGLFGVTTNGEIKNLVVENAKVSGRLNVGVVAGNPYTSKYTNITVKGHVEVNGMAYVGGVGGKNAYADWTNIKVEADETSYVKANSVENGTAYRTYVGGVVGFNGEGGHKFSNITSNIDVEGTTCDVGGLFGIAHYGNQFENCSCSGDVKITAAEEAEEAQEIGGIAGVWNNGGADVVFTNCKFTGTLQANIEGVDFYYGGLVGAPYSATGAGKLIIDGYEMVANGVGLKDGEYYVLSAQGLVWVEAQADNFFAGKTIKLANNIDMAGVTLEKPIKFWNGRTVFDGQNYTISNLTMSTTSTAKQPFGLFGGTADIKNVKFDNANISGYSYVAVVAGNLYGNIDNCHVANSSVTCTYWMAGALSGQYNAGNVTNCSVANTTVTGPAAVGALVGVINETAGERKVENCTVTECTIAQNGSFGGDYDLMFGAAVGLINIENSKVYFTNCNIENTTVKGSASTALYGDGSDSNTVYINGAIIANSAEEFTTALSEGGNIFLQENINITKLDLTNLANDVVIDANGKTITTQSNYGVQVKAGKNITLKNAKVEMTVEGNYMTYAAGLKIENGDYQGTTISLENCEIKMCNTDWAYAVNLPASVKNLNLVINGCTLEGALAVQCWGDNNTITMTNSNLICNYTTSSMYTSYCVALQGDGTNNSENNTLNISGCAFSYSGVDNYNSTIKAVYNHTHNGANTITVDNCTYDGKVEAYE